MAAAALLARSPAPACPGCRGGGEINGLPCRDCQGSTRAVREPRWRKRLLKVAGVLAVPAGTVVGWSRMLPSLGGAAMVSLGASMVYVPAGVVAGGAFLLWIGTELQSRSS